MNRRETAFGLLATSLAAPAILSASPSNGSPPPEFAQVGWEIRDAATKPDAYNLRTAKIPALRARCHSEDAVRRVLDWAKKTNMPFSVQSGGHCFEGLSQSDDLIIDLSGLAETSLVSNTDLIAEPGARLWQVNDATSAINKALPAGYCQHVALGGHVCGGGLGILSRRFGLTCDNLKAARLLTATGDILDVTKDSHPDFFWALQGGGSGSFGIVTEYRLGLHTVESASLTDYFWMVPNSDAGALLHEALELVRDFDRSISPFFYFTAHSEDTILLRLRLVSLATPTAMKVATTRFDRLAVPLMEPQTQNGTYTEIADLMWPREYNPRAWVKNKTAFLKDSGDSRFWQSIVDAMAENWNHDIWASIEQLGGEIDALQPDDTAFVHRRGPEFLVGIGLTRMDSGDPKPTLSAMRRVFRVLRSSAASGTYVNYPDSELTDWKTAYWGRNYPRLARIKRQIDPDNLFRHNQSVGEF